jgi:hypothetical protein
MIPRKRILNLWMKQHQILSDEEQDKFLNRPEVSFLCQESEHVVTSAIEHHKRLADIAQFVIDAIRPAESFTHPTVDTRMWAYGIGFNDSRPQHPSATCPSCKSTLVLKENSHNGNHFWGCPNWRFDSFGCHIAVNISQEEASKIFENLDQY